MAIDQLIAAYHAARGDTRAQDLAAALKCSPSFWWQRGFCPFGWDRLIRTWSTSWPVIHPERVARACLLPVR